MKLLVFILLATSLEVKAERVWVEVSLGHIHNKGFYKDAPEDPYANPLSPTFGVAWNVFSHLGFSLDSAFTLKPGLKASIEIPCENEPEKTCSEEFLTEPLTPQIKRSVGFGAYLSEEIARRVALRGGTTFRLYRAQDAQSREYGLHNSLNLVAKADIRLIKALYAGAEYEQTLVGYKYKTARWHLSYSFK